MRNTFRLNIINRGLHVIMKVINNIGILYTDELFCKMLRYIQKLKLSNNIKIRIIEKYGWLVGQELVYIGEIVDVRLNEENWQEIRNRILAQEQKINKLEDEISQI